MSVCVCGVFVKHSYIYIHNNKKIYIHVFFISTQIIPLYKHCGKIISSLCALNKHLDFCLSKSCLLLRQFIYQLSLEVVIGKFNPPHSLSMINSWSRDETWSRALNDPV